MAEDPAGADDAVAVDGRRLRSERSRTAVLDAMLDLYTAGIIRPSASQIAEASGVSERSLFRHFTDLEDLAASALDRKLSEVRPLFSAPSNEGTRAERIDAMVAARVHLHDELGNLARAAGYHAVSSPTVAQAVADRRATLRRQVERQFAPELDALPKRERRLLLVRLDQMCSLEALDYLRAPSGGDLGPRDVRTVLAEDLTAALAAVPELDPTDRPTRDR